MENNAIPLLECRGLTKSYDGKIALNNLNISLPKGKIIGLLGPNGSGKTTMIKLAAGLLTPSTGEILINGQRPGAQTKAMVSYLPERTYFNESMRITELIDFFKDFYTDFEEAFALEMIAHLGIEKDLRLKTLSKGTKEKIQLVMVMARKAQLYLLDEPIGGVDPAAREYILNTIISGYRQDSTVLISTHLIQDVEKILDEFIFISAGSISVYDSTERIREQYGKNIDQLFREVFRC